MIKLSIYTDFDGTLTKRSGQATVFSSLYNSLLRYSGFYKTTPLKESKCVQDIFINTFGDIYNGVNFDKNHKDIGMLISEDAVGFLHAVLATTEIQLHIVTKNRKDYIKELFIYQGFTEAEIAKVSIHDSGDKYRDVYRSLEKIVGIEHFYVLDDDAHDYEAMIDAIKAQDYNLELITGYHEKSGQFEWQLYLQTIFDKLSKLIHQLSPSSPPTVHAEESTGTAPQTKTNLFDIIAEEVTRIRTYNNPRALDKAAKIEQALEDALSYQQDNPDCTLEAFLHFRKNRQAGTFSILQALAIKRRPYDFIHTPKAYLRITELFKEQLNESMTLHKNNVSLNTSRAEQSLFA